VSDSLLPHNATAQERALEAVVGPPLFTKAPLREIWDPDRCPAELLPWLAFAMSVDEWDPTWPEDAKREVIKQSFQVHQRKGTVGSVRRAVETVFGSARLVEARDDPGLHPFEFAIQLSPGTWLQQKSYQDVVRIVDAVKPVRSRLSAIRVTRSAVTTFYKATALHSGTHLRVGIRFGLEVAPTHRTTGAALHQVKRTEIRPARPSVAVAPAQLMRGTAAHITAKTTIQPRSI